MAAHGLCALLHSPPGLWEAARGQSSYLQEELVRAGLARTPQPPLSRLLAPVSFPAIGVRSGERTVLHQFPGPRDSNGVSCLSFVQAEAAMDESPSDVGHDHSSLRRIQGAVLTLGKPPHMLQESILPRGVHSLTRSEMGVSMAVLI